MNLSDISFVSHDVTRLLLQHVNLIFIVLMLQLYEGPGTFSVHVWAIGCLIYQLVVGHMVRHDERHKYILPEDLREEVGTDC